MGHETGEMTEGTVSHRETEKRSHDTSPGTGSVSLCYKPREPCFLAHNLCAGL
jgi:hypothetical protein